ncbi:hypothetical protein ACFY00_27245 [Kitasatospora sp. NPDC001540]|uniref:hypothetical protein n=1 Tax=Kitasatospora sp. NPDC001540 TaxID=3364014 RepID=UPI0036CCD441
MSAVTEEEAGSRAAGRRDRRRPGRRGPRALLAVAAAVVLLATAVAVAAVPSLREEIRLSFTRRPASFTELYFTADPSIDGAAVTLPMALNAHGTGVKSYQLKVVLQAADGTEVAGTVLTVQPRDGTPVPSVAKLQTTKEVTSALVELVGHPQTLRFRFDKPKTANP